ncbi:MAG: hypothetical protein U0350_16085 [Caldilineaceae bacterium]
MLPNFIEKRVRLSDPVATTGDRVYAICSQNGLFSDPWADDHVAHEGWGVWNHPIKLLDGFWFALRSQHSSVTRWLTEADDCRVGLGYTEFTYRMEPLHITRRDFVPDGVEGMVVTLTVQTPDRFAEPLELLVQVRSDLRPAWLGEEVGMVDGPDQATATADQRYVRFQDANNPWIALVGGEHPAREILSGPEMTGTLPTMGQGATARLIYPLAFQTTSTATFHFFIAGSAESAAAALATFNHLRAEHPTLFAQKQAFYQQIDETSTLTSPDPFLDDAFRWVKINCQMVARATPAQGLGVGAGLPTYPWWFGIDTEYAILPMLQAGLFDLAKASLRLLKQVSEKTNPTEPGRVIHELSTTGVVYNPGNLVETPAFTRAVHQTWLWTGDQAFLAEMYPFCKQGILDYTLCQCDPDGDLCPAGRSVIETLDMHAGFECIDPAAYTWEALGRLADMAQAIGDTAIIPDLETKAARLAQRLQQEWWLEAEGLFADVRASVTEVQEALQRIDAFSAKQPDDHGLQQQVAQTHRLFDPLLAAHSNAPADVDLPWLLRHWVVMCPVEVGLATAEQAKRVLTRLRSPEFCNEWGMYLHPDRHDVMSINTGLLALAHTRYGQIDQALDLAQRMAQTLDQYMPGAISEALPDQWCFVQLWSALGIVSPVVEGVLGITPRAAERKLRVTPQLPTGWDQVALQRLRVGGAWFAVQAKRTQQGYAVSVQSDAPDYALDVGLYLPTDVQVQTVLLNGETVNWRWESNQAGRCLVCAAVGQAELLVIVKQAE